MTGIREALKSPARDISVEGALTLVSGREVPLTGADVLSLTIDEGVDDGLLLGAVLSARHTLKLKSECGAWLPGGTKLMGDALKGATVRLWLTSGGASAALCTFVASDAEGDERAASIVLTGHDSMYEETAGAFADALLYPATLLTVVRHILGNTRYPPISGLRNGGAIIERRPGWGNVSVRQALGYALAMAGSFARISRDGALEIVPVVRPGAAEVEIGAAEVLSRTHAFSDFGPLSALRVETVRDGDGAGEPGEIIAQSDPSEPMTSQTALDLGANPLAVAGTTGARALLDGALLQVAGLAQRRAAFRFRGDPTLAIGDIARVGDAASMLTRQKIVLSRGLSAECELGAPDTSQNALRAITPEGGLNAARLTGVVDGGLLAAESISASAIRARSISAEKLAAGAVYAQAIEAVSARIGEIVSGGITADALYAGIADIARAEIGVADIDGAQIGDASIVAAKIQDASITGAKIGDAEIGTAKIAAGAITTALIGTGAVESAQIADASITDAKIVGLTANKLTAGTINGSVVNVENLNADNIVAGTINGQRIPMLGTDKIEDGAISGAKIEGGAVTADKIVAGAVTADKIAAEAVTANAIAANAVTADKVDILDLFAQQAVVGMLDARDIRNADAITLTVGGEKRTVLRMAGGELVFGEDGADYKAALLGDRYEIRQSGQPVAYFAYNKMWAQATEVRDYQKIGDFTIRRTSRGGLCLTV